MSHVPLLNGLQLRQTWFATNRKSIRAQIAQPRAPSCGIHLQRQCTITAATAATSPFGTRGGRPNARGPAGECLWRQTAATSHPNVSRNHDCTPARHEASPADRRQPICTPRLLPLPQA